MQSEIIRHPFPPLYDRRSEILILGSFPSVKSREQNFFYGHPQNRFWKVLGAVYGCAVPKTIPEKRDFLLSRRIALWDVLASCKIAGSADSSITDALPNDLSPIFETANIRRVFTNGKTADKYYEKYQLSKTGMPAFSLPSTSPANAAWTLERLIDAWRVLLEKNT